MSASRISGFTVAYTAIGGVVLWSGIKGTTLSASFKSVLSGQAPSGNTEPIGTDVSTGSAPSVSIANNPSETQWADSLLQALGAPTSSANVTAVLGWIAREGDFNLPGHNNPLNTTISGYGSTGTLNSAGVQNYATEADGIQATVATIESGYPTILMDLKSGNGIGSNAAGDLSKWSGGGYTSV